MHQLEINGLTVDVVRKNIKNLRLAVYPPHGRVRVAVPLRVDDEAVRLVVLSKWSWIKKQQEKFQQQERQTAREFVSGESHSFQGSRYRLNVILHDGPGRVVIQNKQYIDLYVRPDSSIEQRRQVMAAWYRANLKQSVSALIAKWEPVIGVQVAEWGIKEMKTRWGSCNIEARRIWINLELAKKSIRCLEMVVVHELVHFLERRHNDRFKALMSQYLPYWQLIRDELNREPLAHEEWNY